MTDFEQKYNELLDKHQALFEEYKEVLEKSHHNNSRLLSWNEHMPKTLGVVSLFIFFMVMLFMRADILVLIIDKFGGCVK